MHFSWLLAFLDISCFLPISVKLKIIYCSSSDESCHLALISILDTDGDRFWRMRECYIHGNTTKYLRVPDGVVPSVIALVYQVIEQ
ncbi:putative like-Sm (LSM) domain containing protein, LSm4/SmD1/SmD3 [Rosa chinensis]|uniref:Putative like-Sm (LSM) domain containing protein, LSm4/SmD1/SmD3 n=1 Tax=Rosa chinensis TaxID=74649 RepID=A0A2P6RH20_ROSCH|nr:putative like-Sm (LSM) domain containing protein, LSm4/SmD1/SmD3 [Rosa chinensis]